MKVHHFLVLACVAFCQAPCSAAVAGAADAEDGTVVTKVKERVVTDQDRTYWAFRKPVAGPVPQARASERVRTPVDAFLLAKLETKRLTFSPDASKATLLRRAYLDLIGLPPTPDETQNFLADTEPGAYERLIDRLLHSPHYGERWGRHWLDVAGYTDSPHCSTDGQFLPVDDWRYRDYCIRAFNQDKPYDRFISEQLAGDELVDWRAATEFTPEILDALIATGYLRTTPDWTHGDQNQTEYRADTMSRVVDNVSTGLIGLTMGCVRCHAHKFDPIPHEDYYRMMAIFATAYNPEDWLRPHQRFLADIPPPAREEIEQHNTNIDARLAKIRKLLDDLRAPHKKAVLADRLAKIPEPIRADVETTLATPAAMRNEIQRYLAGKFESMLTTIADSELMFTEAEKVQLTNLGNDAGSLVAQKRSFGRIQGLWDVGKPPVLHQMIRGDVHTPGTVVEPAFLTVLCPPGQTQVDRPADLKGESSGRRLAFAHWLTNGDHPLTARVMVNRVWTHHFGTGIVATPENFGHSGSPPTHPELLDWLAVDFMEHGWSIKRLHRLIMTSTAYRQSARRPPESEASPARDADPDNELLWRMNLRRLEAEVLRDAVTTVSGKLDQTMGGSPIPVKTNPDGLVVVADNGPTPTSKWRRSLYVRSLRGSHPIGQGFVLSMFEIFDFPEVVINCTRRSNSTTPLQSLALTNSEFMMEHARYFTERVEIATGVQATAEKKVETAFLMALGRLPSKNEIAFCVEHLRTQTEIYSQPQLTSEQAGQLTLEQAAHQALSSLCLMLLASNEFLYIG